MKKWIEKILNRFGYYNYTQMREQFKKNIEHKPSWNNPEVNKLILDKITKENANDIDFETDIMNYCFSSLSNEAKQKIITIIKKDETNRAEYFSTMMDNLKIEW